MTKHPQQLNLLQTTKNNIKSDFSTKISVLDVKLNILIAIALIPAAKALGLW